MPSSDCEREDDQTSAEPLLEKAEAAYPAPLLRSQFYLDAPGITTSILLFMLSILWALNGTLFKSSSNDDVCQQPAVRQEWRTLSSSERLEYIRAVRCLSSIPSTLCNGSLHDEFAYIHRNVGEYCTYQHVIFAHSADPFKLMKLLHSFRGIGISFISTSKR